MNPGTIKAFTLQKVPSGGNIFWSSGLREVATKNKQGGKGGGPKSETTTYTYYASWAVALCRGEVTHLNRVWFDEDVSVGRLLECHGTPSAVLLGSDDLLAGGPVVGPDAVVELVQDIKEELAEPLAAAKGAVAPST